LLHGVDWLLVTEVSEDCNDYIFRVQSKKSDKDIMILGKVSYDLPVDKVQHPRELESSEKKMLMKPYKLPSPNFLMKFKLKLCSTKAMFTSTVALKKRPFVGLTALMPRRRIVLLPKRVPSFISRGAAHQAA
jgi:hypothetical protein